MALKRGYQQLLDEAYAEIHTRSLEETHTLMDQEDVVLVDIRDVRELDHEGMIPGAIHAPRGMLEFWVDPDCKYYHKAFESGKQFILYCRSAWRSALAAKTLQDMGMEDVSHMEGGFTAWKEAGYPVGERPRKKRPA